MQLAIGSDDPNHPTFVALTQHLEAAGHVLKNHDHADDWVTTGTSVGQAVGGGEAKYGITCCWTGTGVSIAANKVAGVRAALCTDPEIAEGSRLYNHANVLALPLSLLGPEQAIAITGRWLRTPNGGGENRRLVESLNGLEGRR